MKQYFMVRRKFLRALLISLIVIFSLIIIYKHIGNTVLRPIVIGQIEQITGTTAQISNIKFEITGTVTVNYLGIGEGGPDNREKNIFNARELKFYFSPMSLLLFNPQIKRVTVSDFFFNLLYDHDAKKWNFESFDLKASPPKKLEIPIFRLERGIIKYSELKNGIVEDVVVTGVNGQFAHVGAGRGSYGFTLIADERMGFSGSHINGVWNIGKVGKFEIHDSTISMKNSPILGNNWNIRDFNFWCDYTSDRIDIRNFSFDFGENTHVDITGSVEDYFEDPLFDIHLTANDVFLTDTMTKDALVYGPENMDIINPDLRGFLNQYHPIGWGDVDVMVDMRVSELEKSKWRGRINCRDVTMVDRKFPYTIEDLHGMLEVTEKGSVFESLDCSHNEVDLNISGFAFGGGEKLDMDVTVTSDNMMLDEDLFLALDEKQKELWWVFSPSGMVSINYRTVKKPGIQKQDRLEVELKGTDAIYQHFRYPLTDLRGRLEMEPNLIVLEDVVSSYKHPDGDYSVTLNGRISDIESAQPLFNMVIDTDNLPIDQKLMDAMPPEYRDFYRYFDVDARTDSTVKVFPNAAGRRAVEYIADVTVRGGSLFYEKLPLPLMDVNVDAVLTPDLVKLEQVTGKSGPGTISFNGSIWPVNEYNTKPGFCISADAKSLPLKKELLWALTKSGSGIFSQLHAGGNVDVQANLNINSKSDRCEPYKIEVTCLNNTLVHDRLAYKVENITGQIDITPELIELKDIKSMPGQTGPGVELDGRIIMDGNDIDSASFAIEMKNLELDDKMQAAFEKADLDFYKTLSPSGTMDVSLKKLDIISGEDENIEIDCDGTVSFDDCAFGDTDEISGLTAEITGSGSYVFGKGIADAAANVKVDTVRLMKNLVTDLTGSFEYYPDAKIFHTENFYGKTYGGNVFARAEMINLGKERKDYILEVAIDRLDLESAFEDRAADSSELKGYATGYMNGMLSISGNLAEKPLGSGRFNAVFHDVTLGERTLPAKVVTAASEQIRNKKPQYKFREISVDSYIKGSIINFEEIFMSGKDVLKGTGSLDIDSSELDLDFTAFAHKSETKPSLLGSLAESLSPAVVKVEVGGTLEKPDMRTETLSVIKGPFNIFGPSEE